MRGILTSDECGFPALLKESAPDVKKIYFSGNPKMLEKPCIAVVGSRKCTEYGKTVARNIGKRVAESGAVLVSGLAKGIDTAAHMGAVDGGGNTIAVLGNGCDIFYPGENRNLQTIIEERGLLISEYAPGIKPRPYYFPLRNRIISGISESVVVAEAGEGSGALITAEIAAEQGKRLYAVPGNITSYYSFGTNKLIRENVRPLIFVDDVLLDLGIKPGIQNTQESGLGADEKTVFEALRRNGEMTVEEIYHITDIKPSEISGIITVLEMKGLVFSCLGKVTVAKF